jgi:hypothetical protein
MRPGICSANLGHLALQELKQNGQRGDLADVLRRVLTVRCWNEIKLLIHAGVPFAGAGVTVTWLSSLILFRARRETFLKVSFLKRMFKPMMAPSVWISFSRFMASLSWSFSR